MKRPLSLIQIAALAYALMFSGNLLEAWRYAPFERGSWLALLLWLLPPLGYRLGLVDSSHSKASANWLLVTGILINVTGLVGYINSLKNIGLACVIASFVPFSPLSLVWLISALAWMRPMGWLGSRYFPEILLPMRLVVTGIPTLLLLGYLRRQK